MTRADAGAEAGAKAGSEVEVEVIGAGVAGLVAATVLAERGAQVRLLAASDGTDPSCCSWWAGGMLAPDVEGEAAAPAVLAMAGAGLAFWRRHAEVTEAGTLVLAPPRDAAELRRFARLTGGHETLDADGIARLEPDLAGRFRTGLHYTREAHLDPRAALAGLRAGLEARGVAVVRRRLTRAELAREPARGWRIDARGWAAGDLVPDLRGVRGEMVVLRTGEIRLSRPVRLLHPRWPLYVVPRPGGIFMLGATQIESARAGRPTVRAVHELLSAAWALSPAFGEAELVETGADLRPAFPDNCPRVRRRGRVLHLNGLFRHGFLAAPALAEAAAGFVLEGRPSPLIEEEDRDLCAFG